MALKVVKASDVIVGNQIPEEDGFLFDVIDVEDVSASEVEITLASSFSSNPAHWECNGGTTVRYPKDDPIYISA